MKLVDYGDDYANEILSQFSYEEQRKILEIAIEIRQDMDARALLVEALGEVWEGI
jgi:hypothetical protein